eukprot:scaffold7068_cov301-Pinguiococcus_pyrenoidosus.AAC.2
MIAKLGHQAYRRRHHTDSAAGHDVGVLQEIKERRLVTEIVNVLRSQLDAEEHLDSHVNRLSGDAAGINLSKIRSTLRKCEQFSSNAFAESSWREPKGRISMPFCFIGASDRCDAESECPGRTLEENLDECVDDCRRSAKEFSISVTILAMVAAVESGTAHAPMRGSFRFASGERYRPWRFVAKFFTLCITHQQGRLGRYLPVSGVLLQRSIHHERLQDEKEQEHIHLLRAAVHDRVAVLVQERAGQEHEGDEVVHGPEKRIVDDRWTPPSKDLAGSAQPLRGGPSRSLVFPCVIGLD